MTPAVLLAAASEDARALLAAAEANWSQPVPDCPGWNTADLVRHTGGIFEWMAAVVSSSERVSRRTLDAPPEQAEDLPSWYLGALDRAVAVLGAADPDAETWTFSSTGEQRVWWWCRRLAVEVAIHRWDAQYAAAQSVGPPPRPLDAPVSAAGIQEFVAEFLPGLLKQDGIDLHGTLHLVAIDGDDWWLDLDAQEPNQPKSAKADTTLRGTRSDLLLWLTNRDPSSALHVTGNRTTSDHWHRLRR